MNDNNNSNNNNNSSSQCKNNSRKFASGWYSFVVVFSAKFLGTPAGSWFYVLAAGDVYFAIVRNDLEPGHDGFFGIHALIAQQPCHTWAAIWIASVCVCVCLCAVSCGAWSGRVVMLQHAPTWKNGSTAVVTRGRLGGGVPGELRHKRMQGRLHEACLVHSGTSTCKDVA